MSCPCRQQAMLDAIAIVGELLGSDLVKKAHVRIRLREQMERPCLRHAGGRSELAAQLLERDLLQEKRGNHRGRIG